jgi:hypothetical protein
METLRWNEHKQRILERSDIIWHQCRSAGLDLTRERTTVHIPNETRFQVYKDYSCPVQHVVEHTALHNKPHYKDTCYTHTHAIYYEHAVIVI